MINNIVEERKRTKNRAKLEEKLMKKYFRKQQIYVGDSSILVHPNRRAYNSIPQQRMNVLVHKSIGEPKMTIYDKAILSEAERFAEAYQENFPSEQNFIINHGYGKRY